MQENVIDEKKIENNELSEKQVRLLAEQVEDVQKDKNSGDKLRNILKVTGTVLTVILVLFSILIYRSVKWMLRTWSNLSMEEIVFHLKSPLQGTDSDLGVYWFLPGGKHFGNCNCCDIFCMDSP